MKDRYSIVSKWTDNWYMSLSPKAKLLFSFLCDTCDEAGFVELNSSLWVTQTKLTIEEIKSALLELKKNLLSDKKSKLWVKTHLFWQRKLPLYRGIEEHDWIIRRLESMSGKFNDSTDILDVLSRIVEPIAAQSKAGGKKAVTPRNLFVIPTYEDFSAEYRKQKPDILEDDIKSLFNHYSNNGWVVGKGNRQMRDYAMAIENSIIRNNKDQRIKSSYNSGANSGSNSAQKKSKSETTFNVVNKMQKTAPDNQ